MRRSVCPRCGNPVGVPSLEPTHRGATAGPMTPQERWRLSWAKRARGEPAIEPEAVSSRQVQAAAPQPQDGRVVRLLKARKRRFFWRRRERQMETHWYQCLTYPFRAWLLVFGLAAVLIGVTGGTALLIPELLAREDLGTWPGVLWLTALLVPLIAAGYTCGLFECTFTSALAGEAHVIRWPGRNVLLALRSAGTWLACFLVGPAVSAATALAYWIHCGPLIFLDYVILTELMLFTVAYGLFVVLAAIQRDRLRDANPARVAELVHRLGYRAAVAALVAFVLVLTNGFLTVIGLQELHREPALGWLLLGSAWLLFLFGGTFLFRLLGVWCYRMPSVSTSAIPGSAATEAA